MDPLAGRLVEQLQDDPEAPEVVGLEGEDADVIFDALSSETTREVLSKCYDGGRTRSELADELDTSLQNVSYHVEKLEGAGLIEPAEIRYGENRQEVRVYEPSKEAILIAAGETGLIDRIKHAVERLFSPVVILALAASAIASIARNPEGAAAVGGLLGSDDDDAPTDDVYTFSDDAETADDVDEPATDDDVAEETADDADTATVDDVDDAADESPEEEAPTAEDDDVDAVGDQVEMQEQEELDVTADAAAESTDLLIQEPWFLAGASVFLLGFVVVVTADRFGLFNPRPRRQRTGQSALLLGRESTLTRTGFGAALGLGLATIPLLYAAFSDLGGVLGVLAGYGPGVAFLAAGIGGGVHAARNDGVLVTISLVLAPLLAGWLFLLGAPALADGALQFAAGSGALAVGIGVLLGLVTYAGGVVVAELWGRFGSDGEQ